MRIHRRREEDEGLPMTPLIDVVFQLLLFFLTATSFHRIEKDIKVDPPKASEGRSTQHPEREITVNVRSEADGGFLVINEKILTLEQVTRRLFQGVKDNPNLVVIIRGDKHAYHQRVVDVLNACKKANVKHYFIATAFETHKE
ncbi:MAG TPA: biopolymer transporter ExbD [Planctomycetota bacterium]|nr:biopolymer transporter ExbD [Planctomycetota bacterium]